MKKAIFLDRDGVINKKPAEHDYVKSLDELHILPTFVESIKLIKEHEYLVIIITNQRGVARGLMSHYDLHQIHEQIHSTVRQHGLAIDGAYACMHDYDDQCYCRKPFPGMLLKAINEFDIDPSQSWMIGDSKSDVLAGLAAGVQVHKIESNAPLIDAVRFVLGLE